MEQEGRGRYHIEYSMYVLNRVYTSKKVCMIENEYTLRNARAYLYGEVETETKIQGTEAHARAIKEKKDYW
jgi:hypothetical protein